MGKWLYWNLPTGWRLFSSHVVERHVKVFFEVASDVQQHWPLTSIDLDVGFGDGCPAMSSPKWRSATWKHCVQGYAKKKLPRKRAVDSRVHAQGIASKDQRMMWNFCRQICRFKISLLDPTQMAMLKRIPSGNRFTRTKCDNPSNTRCCMVLPTKTVQLRRAHSGLSLNEIIVDK